MMNQVAKNLLNVLRQTTTGIKTQYPLADGRWARRIYLDSSASTLQLAIVKEVLDTYLPHYANTHTEAHFGAKLSTQQYAWAHQMVLQFVHADIEQYISFFVGSGTTGAINRIAQTLSRKYPERDVVITTIMEHHSNDLPHRENFKKVIHVPMTMTDESFASVDLDILQNALEKYAGRVNYVAISGVSNVTGISNPIYDVAELAHQYDSLILIDAAQMAAHAPIHMSSDENPMRHLDMIAMSGHKIYAPSSPGVVVARKALFEDIEPVELGGGMVDVVHVERYLLTQSLSDREEAGTPNIAGAIALASVLYTLQKIGMQHIEQHETDLMNYCLEQLLNIEQVTVYGETDSALCKRIGAVSINIKEMHHALTAAILNDYFNIAVRNACFCAQPYVRELIEDESGEQLTDLYDALSNDNLETLVGLQRGMVRISFGIYNTREDVDIFINALQDICQHKDYYQQQYIEHTPGEYRHKDFRFDSDQFFSVQQTVDQWLSIHNPDLVSPDEEKSD